MNCKKTKKLVYGVGVNDAEYVVEVKETIKDADGKQKRKTVWLCPLYQTWKSMLDRCYSSKRHARQPTYVGCSVTAEWHKFSAFRNWMESQDWEGRQLDKDLLMPGNRMYGPDACVFVSQAVNNFVTDSGATRGEWPIGVSWSKHAGKFQARCSNPFTGKQEYLGYFDCPQQAHLAWLKRKRELAKELAAVQDDPRVAKAIIARYENYEEDV